MHLVGHSYGSLVGSRFAQLHPQAVLTMTLLDPVSALHGRQALGDRKSVV